MKTRILMQQADAAGGSTGGQGAGAGAGGAAAGAGGAAAAAGGAAAAGSGAAAGDQGKAGTNTNDGKGTAGTPAWKPTAFVPKLPEGTTLEKNPVLKEYYSEFNAVFADDKLSTEGKMQALVDLQGKYAQKAIAARAEQERKEQDRIAAQPGMDLESLKADKDFGGPNFKATVDGAKMIEAYAFGEDLGKLLGPLGMQSDPVILKGLARLARVISPDAIGVKTGRNEQQVDEVLAMFPKSGQQMRDQQRRR